VNRIEIKSIAKINIGLRILSKRKDGFHNLQTLFYPVSGLYDNLIFSKSDKLDFSSNIAKLNSDSNLILKAIKLIEEQCSVKLNVKITLNKKIPIGAGLGGGSSNAAKTLLSINKLYNLSLSNNKLMQLALSLGSDVPLFLTTLPAIGTSRGELLQTIKFNFDKFILLVNPGIHISTKEAFGNLKSFSSDLINYPNIIKNGIIDFSKFEGNIKNDFENYVFEKYEEVSIIKNIMLENRALFSQMSGTGSTVYGIFDNLYDAKHAAELFPKNYFTHLELPKLNDREKIGHR